MARRDVGDMNEVQAGFDEGRHPTGGRFDDDAAGRRRPHVARADRGGGIDDHRGQALLGDHALDQPLGNDLAPLVGADRLCGAGGAGLVGGAGGIGLQRRHAAGIDDPFDIRGQRGLHHRPRAGEVVADDLLGVTCPDPVIGGDVEQVPHAFHRRGHGGGIARIALDEHAGETLQVRTRARGTDQAADLPSLCGQNTRHRGTNETRYAGDEHHIQILAHLASKLCPRALHRTRAGR